MSQKTHSTNCKITIKTLIQNPDIVIDSPIFILGTHKLQKKKKHKNVENYSKSINAIITISMLKPNNMVHCDYAFSAHIIQFYITAIITHS